MARTVVWSSSAFSADLPSSADDSFRSRVFSFPPFKFLTSCAAIGFIGYAKTGTAEGAMKEDIVITLLAVPEHARPAVF